MRNVEDWLKGEVRVLDGAAGRQPHGTSASLLDEAGRAKLLSDHRDYAAAGADIVTANTHGLNRRCLRAAGLEGRAQELRDAAVSLARLANPTGLTAGSVAPVEDCYDPSVVLGDLVLREEHGDSIAGLVEAGVDLVLAETMGCVREAVVCAEVCRSLDIPVLISFASSAGGELPSGERLTDALSALAPFRPLGVLVNCAGVTRCRKALESVMPWGPVDGGLLLGAYADIVDRPQNPRSSPLEFAALARNLVRDFGLKLIGACCGSTPEHIRQLASAYKLSPAPAR